MLFIFIIYNLFNISLFFLKDIFASFQTIVCNFFICLIILFRPSFLNKIDLKITIKNTFNINFKSVQILERFKADFFEKMYFIKQTCSLEEFSIISGFNKQLINDFVVDMYGMSFLDLVNKSRIDLFIKTIEDDKFNHLTLDALSESVGFGSRSSLYRSFKKFHGGVPSDLIRALS